MWGISYPGFYTAAGMIDAHPALKAASPQAPVTDWFIGDDWHHNGAFFLPHAFNFMADFGQPAARADQEVQPHASITARPTATSSSCSMGPLANADAKYFKGDVAFWNEVMQHGTYDEFWKARNLRPHLKNITPGGDDRRRLVRRREPVRRPGDLSSTIEANEPGASNMPGDGPVGPRRLGRAATARRSGSVTFNAKTAEFYREQIEFPFFEFHLKGKGEFKLPEAWVFETGTNQWRQVRRLAAEDGPKPKSLYLHADGQLAFEPPERAERRPSTSTSATRPSRCPIIDTISHRHDAASTWSPTSGSPPGGPTCWSTRPKR